MHRIRQGLAGTALVAAVATTVALLPGAEAVNTPTDRRGNMSAASVTSESMQQDRRKGTISSRVVGEFGRNGVVRGNFDPKRFIVQKGDAYAVGVLHATLRRGDNLIGRIDRQITIPIKNARTPSAGLAAAAAPCSILHLVLGPLDLNLLGLHVTLNRVRLNIEAIPGAGALLGNLLCAVAGLLDGPDPLGQLLRLSNLLNRILSILRA